MQQSFLIHVNDAQLEEMKIVALQHRSRAKNVRSTFLVMRVR